MLKQHIIYGAGLFLLLFGTILPAHSQQKKTLYSILLDNTGTMNQNLAEVKKLSQEIVQQTSEDDSVAIFNFATDYKNDKAVGLLGTEWKQNRVDVDKYINNLSTVKGSTVLFDTIYAVAKLNNEKANSGNDKFMEKIVVLITDGEDRYSTLNKEQLIKQVKETGVKIYTIGFIRELSTNATRQLPNGTVQPFNPQKESEKFLKRLSEETGGRAVFPKKRADPNMVIKELLAIK